MLTEDKLPTSKYGDKYIDKIKNLTNSKKGQENTSHHQEQIEMIFAGMKKFEDEYESEIKKIEDAANEGKNYCVMSVPEEVELHAQNWCRQQKFKIEPLKSTKTQKNFKVEW